ncbi:hypothetical protein JNJ66_03235 [Candidatus Saccharibacteria bacterium]|nr:hypothetical protein [Candidatus Saccharibacteria bacterium]
MRELWPIRRFDLGKEVELEAFTDKLRGILAGKGQHLTEPILLDNTNGEQLLALVVCAQDPVAIGHRLLLRAVLGTKGLVSSHHQLELSIESAPGGAAVSATSLSPEQAGELLNEVYGALQADPSAQEE